MSEEISPTLLKSLDPRKLSNDEVRSATLIEIDRSCRAPLLIFIISGLIWLLIGTGLALIASIKLPSFARPVAAKSRAVPWSTDVRIKGMPIVAVMLFSKLCILIAI